MNSKIKNIIIFIIIGGVLILGYVFFVQTPSDTAPLVSSLVSELPVASPEGENSSLTQDFLTLLLSVKNIKLNDAIFSDSAFNSLRDSSITLTQDGNEGRPNPFAPLGSDTIAPLTP